MRAARRRSLSLSLSLSRLRSRSASCGDARPPLSSWAFIGYFAARLFVDTWLRQRLTPPLPSTWLSRKADPAGLQHAWVISQYPSDRFGHAIALNLGPCPGGNPKACLAAQVRYMHAVYEPARRFWSMQFVEFGLFAGIAVVLIAFAAWWVDRRV